MTLNGTDKTILYEQSLVISSEFLCGNTEHISESTLMRMSFLAREQLIKTDKAIFTYRYLLLV